MPQGRREAQKIAAQDRPRGDMAFHLLRCPDVIPIGSTGQTVDQTPTPDHCGAQGCREKERQSEMISEPTDWENWLDQTTAFTRGDHNFSLPACVNAKEFPVVLRALYMAGYGPRDALWLILRFVRPESAVPVKMFSDLIGQELRRCESVRLAWNTGTPQ